MQRALNLKKKFKKNSSFHEEYSNFMNDMFKKGHAIKVPTPHLSRQDGQVWYIPHHGVYHPQKKRLRVFFDCAASFQGVSLNSKLLQGPDMTNSLIGVLTCFRQESVAMMADVEAMYYQVRVTEKDTDIKVQGSCLFVTYTIIQGIISSEMEVRTGLLNGQYKK